MSHDEEYERALWNNSFYSSPAVLTESSSSNHITNLRKSVNLPNSASIQSLSGHLAENDDSGAVSGGHNGGIPGSGPKLEPEPASAAARTVGNRTSLMRVSPSMKALEHELNAESRAANSPAAIAEEDEDDRDDEISTATDVKSAKFAQKAPTAPDAHREGTHDLQFQQPGSRVSAFSLATFHTAKSTDSFAANAPDASANGLQGSAATVELPAVSLDENTPKLRHSSLAASVRSAEEDGDGGASSSAPETVPGSVEDKKGFSAGSTEAYMAPGRPLESPTMGGPKSMVASSSCPALSTQHRVAPNIPQETDVENVSKTGGCLETSGEKRPEVPEKPPADASPAKQAPVRSLLDSPFIVPAKSEKSAKSAKSEEKPAAKDLPNRTRPAVAQPKHESPAKSSSAFGTPRSQAASARGSPRKSYSDVGVSNTPSFYGHQRSATDVESTQNSSSVSDTKPAGHKRFSFRGLFKIKSKNHSLSKLKDVDEELKHGSRPVKLSAKSFSTPNMSALAKDDKEQKKPKKEAKAGMRFFMRKGSSGVESSRDTPSVPDKETPPPKSKREKTLPERATKSSSAEEVRSLSLPDEQATPAVASSVFSAETPSTAFLESKRNTIREVDDSDYSPNITRDSPTPSNESKDVNLAKGESSQQQREPEFSPYVARSNMLDSPSDSASPNQFGSPFKLSYPSERPDFSPRAPTSLRYQPPQSPSRSMNSRMSNEQLAGETLFPKSLDALEVESIVSLERSRSMRSIRSNKRSSFLNYNGSDENIILGKNLANVSQTSMKRSGSILKNSPSAQSLNPDRYHSIEKAFENAPPQDTTQNIETDSIMLSNNDIDFGDFIEFSDYIDFDNLDFTTSPLPEPYTEADQSLASPSLGIYIEDESGIKTPIIEQPESYVEQIDSTSAIETTSALDTSTAIDTTSLNNSDGKGGALTPTGDILIEQKPEIICVSSHTSQEFDTSRGPSDDTNGEITNASLDPAPGASPLDKTFKFAIDDNTRAVDASKPRPVSMSFKGFNGSAFKDRILPQSGSHQSIQFDDDSANESFAVGQGFGSSDEDSDDDSDSFEGDLDSRKFNTTIPELRKADNEPKKMNSFDRRQQHLKNVLDLQPPSSSLPFHHNRIPSISDQSSVSSPKSLTSFISRIRKSPKASPKVPVPRATVKFSSRIILYDTYHHDEYDRHPEIATCNQLTPYLAQQIKEELNELKANMEVHEDSICYTQFF